MESIVPYHQSTDESSKKLKLVTVWLNVFAETKKRHANHILTRDTYRTWERALAEIPVEDLERGFQRASRECEWFPSDTEIRKLCPGGNVETAAEQAWELVQAILHEHWHPDIGFYNFDPSTFDAATAYAMRAVGGIGRIADETNAIHNENFAFVQRDFLHAYQRFRAEDGAQNYLSHQLAADTLAQLEAARLDLEAASVQSAIAPSFDART